MIETVQRLLDLQADVNVVALNDVMPLNLAYGLPDSDEWKQDIIDLLIKRYTAIFTLIYLSLTG